jgi:predicted transcriptional regulator
MATLTIRIDDELEKQLEALARAQHSTKSQVVRELLKKDMLLARFEAARREMIPYAQAAGYYTDEDVFRDIS